MNGVKEVVAVIHVVNVAIVVVGPTHGPGLNKFEPVTAVLEAGMVLNDDRVADSEVMFAAKVLPEFIVGNTLAI